MSASPPVCLISVCFNDEGMLPAYVESLERLRYPSLRHVIVDNNSRDGSVAFFRRTRPEAVLIESKTNLATTGGYNLAFRRAMEFEPRYVLISAIDVVLEPDFLVHQVGVMERDPQIGILGPVVYLEGTGVIQSFGFALDPRTQFTHSVYGGLAEAVHLPPLVEADYVDGGTALVRAHVMAELGGFDERLCIYGEDADLCLRAKRLGYKVMANAQAKAYHRYYERRADGPPLHQVFYSARNRVYLAEKLYGTRAKWSTLRYWLFPPVSRFGGAGRAVKRFGTPRRVAAHFLGLAYGTLGLMGKRLFLQ